MIGLATEGPVARITLEAPERHNALDRAGIAALGRALDEIDASDAARAVILTGRGKSFCSGAALDDISGSDWTENPLTALCNRLERFRLPTVCALNGGAYGGGVELALCCDFRVGVRGMRMFVPPAELGIHYPAEGLARAERLLGLQLTRRIFLLAERFGDEALLEIGFLDRLVPPEAFAAEAEALANRLAGLAPLAVQGMKQTLAEIGQGGFDPAAAKARVRACFASADHAEGLAAFAEKRAPVFRGR